ncbi:MAG: hypothetical protein E7434_06510 [Ruminococcaceae bacterium]|nr:hypothetical protein [Oscillospiraceae bacterium]
MKRIIALILLWAMLTAVLPVNVQAAGDALPMQKAKKLLNSVELCPQKTGYIELDRALEEVLGDNRDEDAFTQIKAAYDWTIHHINFSWAPYSQDWAPAYDCFNVTHELTLEEGRREVIPWEVANRAYHALTRNEGVCYDYAALFAVMARYIGIDAYIHTGMFTFEAIYGGNVGHHGWVVLDIDGEYYIFDSQRDYRLSGNGTMAIPYEYFAIPMEDSWRYAQETELNALRDAQFLSVKDLANVMAVSSSSCEVEGEGLYPSGSEVTLEAICDKPFLGWFDADGVLLCAGESYTFVAETSVCVYAMCEGEYFRDVKASDWYFDYANEALRKGIVSGVDAYQFAPQEPLTRAMALTILARYAGDDSSADDAGFLDVKHNSWYESAVNWAVENDVTKGYPDNTFRPDAHISREEFITMLVRYAASDVEGTKLMFTDKGLISDYARKPMQRANTIGLLTGYDDGTIRPNNELTRAEGVAILMRLVEWLGEEEE